MNKGESNIAFPQAKEQDYCPVNLGCVVEQPVYAGETPDGSTDITGLLVLLMLGIVIVIRSIRIWYGLEKP